MGFTWIWHSLCLLTCLGTCYAYSLLIHPKNQVVVVGQPTTFRCRPDIDGVTYSWQVMQGGSDIPMTTGKKIYDPYLETITLDVRESTRDYNLVINRTLRQNASRYSCRIQYPLYTSYAELVVLDEPPSCEVSTNLTDLLENDTFSVVCTASYSGRWDPALTCHDAGSDIPVRDMGSMSGSRLQAGFTVQMASAGLRGHRYRCGLSFPSPPSDVLEEDGDTVHYSRETPAYSFDYTSDIINVQFPVRNIQIGGLREEHHPLDEVRCRADGWPDVRVRWVNANTSQTVVSGQVLVVTAAMEGVREYRCEVENRIRDVVYRVNRTISFVVTIPTTTTTTTVATTTSVTSPHTPGPSAALQSGLSGGHIAGIVVGVLVALIILFIVLYVLLCRRAPSKGISKEKLKPRLDGVDQVRRQSPPAVPTKPPHPYDAAKPTNNDFAKPPVAHAPNQWGDQLNPPMYDVALDDTPRSRKPVQVYDSLDYTDFRRV